MTDIKPYVPSTITEVSNEDFNRSVREIFQKLYNSDEDFKATATSTDRDEAVQGSVNADKYAVAHAIHTYAVESGSYPEVVAANWEKINRAAGWGARHFKVGRAQIAAAKEEWKALQSAPSPFHRDGDYLAG